MIPQNLHFYINNVSLKFLVQDKKNRSCFECYQVLGQGEFKMCRSKLDITFHIQVAGVYRHSSVAVVPSSLERRPSTDLFN